MAFLDMWLREAPTIFEQELAGGVEFQSTDQLPVREDSLCCQIELQDGMRGSFWVVVAAKELAAILVEARITDPEPDAERDAQLWLGVLRQIAAKVVKSADRQVTVSRVQRVPSPSGLALIGYLLRFGKKEVRIAFADQTRFAVSEQLHEGTSSSLPVRGIELLLDVELEASLRFGSREMPLSEVLDLGPGDVVQLERHVSDPVDLIVGDKIVARGEVVLVNGNFGLRVTEVAEPRKSLESIRCLF